MANSVVSIAINAKNLAGGAFNQLRSQIAGVSGALSKFEGQTNTTRNSVTGMTGQVAGLISGYFTLGGAINLATQAFSSLTSAGNEAMQRQVEQVSALSTAMQTLGLSQRDAGKFTQGIQADIARLGRDLPVAAEGIQVFSRTIQDDYAIALKNAGASLETIKNAQLGSASRIAILSDLSGGDVSASRAAISSFLAGSVGAGGLNRYQFFANNPQLNSAIKSGLAAKGANSTGDLSALERVKLLTESLEKVVTPEMINLLQGTVKARLSAFMDSLFDPTIGLFSIERDLEPKIDGYQSVFTAFGDTLDIVIGNNGILSNFSRLFGFEGKDPLRSVYDGINAFNAFLLGVSGTLATLKTLSPSIALSSIGKFSATISNFLIGVGRQGIDALSRIDYKELFKGIVIGVGQFFLTLDYKQLLIDIPIALTKMAGSIVGGLFGAIAELGQGLLQTVSEEIDKFANSISKAFDNLIGFAYKRIAQVAGIETDGTAGTTIGSAVKSAASTSINFATNPLGTLAGLVGGFFSRADGFIPANGGLIGALASEAARKPPGTDFVIANSSETILTPNMLSNLVGNLTGGSKTVNFQAGSIVFNLPSGTPQEIAMAAIAIIEQALLTELESKIA